MRNYYYVASLNLQHPRVKALIDKLKISDISESMIGLCSRSKIFASYHDVQSGALNDFALKFKKIIEDDPEDKDQTYRVVPLVNPAFTGQADVTAAILGQSMWDPNCAGTIMCCDDIPEEIDDEDMTPSDSWMVKYDLYFADDIIEQARNGEFILQAATSRAATSFSSTYH